MIIKWLTKSGLSHIFGVVGFSKCSNISAKYASMFKELNNLMKQYDVYVQLLDATKVADWDHLYFATFQALYAFKNGYNISKSISVEILLYSAATRQISEAISKLGVGKDSKRIAAVIVSSNIDTGLQSLVEAKNALMSFLGCYEDDRVLSINGNKVELIRDLFKISPTELDIAKIFFDDDVLALKNCVIERIALLSLEI